MQRIINFVSGMLVELHMQSVHDNDHCKALLPRRRLAVQTLKSVTESDLSASHGVIGRTQANLVDVRIVKYPLTSSSFHESFTIIYIFWCSITVKLHIIYLNLCNYLFMYVKSMRCM